MKLIIKSLVVWGGAILLGLYIWNICMARIVVATDPQKALKLYPTYSEGFLKQNRVAIQKIKTASDVQHIEGFARTALNKLPLSEEPFLHTGLANSIYEGKFVQKSLFVEAKKRNIRNVAGLRSLIGLAIAENDIPSIVENLDILMQMGGEDVDPYYDAISSIITTEQGREIINFYLQKRPNWAAGILIKQINTMQVSDIDNISKSLSFYSKTDADILKDKYLHMRFLEELTNLGAYQFAYKYWEGKRGSNRAAGNRFAENTHVHDNRFETSTALPPFNWKLSTGPKFFAEYEQGGGLYASYAGDRPIELASQFIILTPEQTYQLKTAAQWQYKQRQGKFLWRLRCFSSKQVIAELNLEDQNLSIGGGTVEFTVPPNCEGLNLQLLGISGQYSERIHTIIQSVSVAKVDT